MRTRRSRNRNSAEAEINMGAFSDIAFQLIIFFMICTSFNRPKAQEMEIPAVDEESEDEAEKKMPTIDLFASQIRLNNRAISRRRLEDWLDSKNYKKIKSDRPEDTVVVLQAQADVDYGRFYDIVSLVERYGGTITIMEEEKGGGGGG